MRRRCPCGCGRKLRIGTIGAARAYARIRRDMDAARPTFDWAVQAEMPDRSDWPEIVRNVVALRERGEHVEGWLLARVHGTALAGVTPDMVELHRMVKQYEEELSALDAMWVERGGSSTAA